MSINDSKNPFGNQQPRSAFQLVFYFIVFGLASIIPILLAPSLITGVSLVSLEKSQLYAVALLVGSYATALLLLFLPIVFRQTTHYLYKFLIVFIVFGASFFLLYEYQNQEIAFLVMTTVLVSGLCLWIFQRALMFPYTVLSVFVVATAVLIWLTDFGILSDRASGRLKTQKNLQV